MNNPTGAAPPCAICGQHRDANVHLAQYMYADYHTYRGERATTLEDMLEVLDTMDESIPHGIQRVVDVLRNAKDGEGGRMLNHPRLPQWVHEHRPQIHWWKSWRPK